jgi:hypothetical protein
MEIVQTRETRVHRLGASVAVVLNAVPCATRMVPSDGARATRLSGG